MFSLFVFNIILGVRAFTPLKKILNLKDKKVYYKARMNVIKIKKINHSYIFYK